MSSLDLSKNKKIIQNIALAYSWKKQLENENLKSINSLTDLAKKERISVRQVRKFII